MASKYDSVLFSAGIPMGDKLIEANHFDILSIPLLAYPYIVKLSAEIKDEGTIISINTKDETCTSVISLIKSRPNRENSPHSSDELVDMYRIDNISRSGVSTLFVPTIVAGLLSLDPRELMLEHFFGIPDISNELQHNQELGSLPIISC